MYGAKIKHIEFKLPKNKISNSHFFEDFPEYNFQRFEKKVGIKERYVLDNENSLDLAIDAVKELIANSELSSDKVDYIIHCTQSPAFMLPTSACVIQDVCGFSDKTGALDINLGCSGYTYGLMLANSLIRSGIASNIILVTSDAYTKYIHPEDLTNRLIFGDAATASWIAKDDKDYFGDFVFGTDGSGYDKLIVRNNYFNKENQIIEKKFYPNGQCYSDNHLFMNGSAVFQFTLDRIPNLIKEVLEKNKMDESEIDSFIFHQANKFLVHSVASLSGIPLSKVFLNLDKYGNTVSSTIPIALKEFSKLSSGRRTVVLSGFGVGLSWCACPVIIDNNL